MDLFKNVEVVLMIGFGTLCAIGFSARAIEPAPAPQARVQPGPMPVVVITGKRLASARHDLA